MKKFLLFIKKYYIWFIVGIVFLSHIFLRFYLIEQKNTFGWDQVDNAWAAVNIIVHHKVPLVGMVAKQNSGFYIGPLYYYLVAFFYFFTNLDPIASGILAGLVSIFSFFTIFLIIKKIFSEQVALFAIIINTISFGGIVFDRVQWPVSLFPSISLIIFYCLYKVLLGEVKYILFLAIALGFAFNLHFTAIFFLPIILLCLPFFPKRKKTLLYLLVFFPIMAIFLLPNIIAEMQTKHAAANNFLNYFHANFLGFHGRRVLQVFPDSLIQFEAYLNLDFLKLFKYLLIPIFFILYCLKEKGKKIKIVLSLILLLFIIPLVIFSTYRGEISDYYFSINRYIVLFIIAYCLYHAWNIRNIIFKVIVSVAIIAYGIYNIDFFFNHYGPVGLAINKQNVKKAIASNKIIQFTEGDPESYLYYIYTRGKHQ